MSGLKRLGLGVVLLATYSWFITAQGIYHFDRWQVDFESMLAFMAAVGAFVYNSFLNTNRVPLEVGLESPASGNLADYPKWDEHDASVAKQFLEFFDAGFLYSFGGNGLPQKFPREIYDKMRLLSDAGESSAFAFSDKGLDKNFQAFLSALTAFVDSGLCAIDCPSDKWAQISPEYYHIEFDTVSEYLDSRNPNKEDLERALLKKMSFEMSLVLEAGQATVKNLREIAPLTFSKYQKLH
ncbi:MAG: hypothetical protein ACU0A8_03010 [Limimaricola soesokkakensis]|uniref:hypothetical protein n=1 Tax=Limimaricola soesokkakensis TaxID=1343159 RepID=UPI00405A2158